MTNGANKGRMQLKIERNILENKLTICSANWVIIERKFGFFVRDWAVIIRSFKPGPSDR